MPIRRNTTTGRLMKGGHWRKAKPFWDRDWLHREYVEAGRSTEDIGAEFGVGDSAIQYWLHKHGIESRTTSEVRAAKHWGASGEANPMYGRRGQRHPNWQGGRTPMRQKLYASIEWKEARLAVFVRDSACRLCGAKGKLVIHHINKFADAPMWWSWVDNLIRLCVPCHHRTYGRERYWRARLWRILHG